MLTDKWLRSLNHWKSKQKPWREQLMSLLQKTMCPLAANVLRFWRLLPEYVLGLERRHVHAKPRMTKSCQQSIHTRMLCIAVYVRRMLNESAFEAEWAACLAAPFHS